MRDEAMMSFSGDGVAPKNVGLRLRATKGETSLWRFDAPVELDRGDVEISAVIDGTVYQGHAAVPAKLRFHEVSISPDGFELLSDDFEVPVPVSYKN